MKKLKDPVWLVYERPDLNSFRTINNGLLAPLVFGDGAFKRVHDYETHRELCERKVAMQNVASQVPGSFYKNFRIEEIAKVEGEK